MTLAPLLLDLLVCPEDKGPLLWFEDEALLYNPRLRRCYRVSVGIPNLLTDDATAAAEGEHQRLMALALDRDVRATGPASE